MWSERAHLNIYESRIYHQLNAGILLTTSQFSIYCIHLVPTYDIISCFVLLEF